MGQPPVLTSPNPLSTLQKQFACARLSRPCLPGSSSRLFCNVHHPRFWRQQLAVAWDQRPDRRTRRAFLHLSYSYATAVWTGVTRDTRPISDVSGECFCSGCGFSALSLDERRGLRRNVACIALRLVDKPVAETTYGWPLERFGRGDRVITKLGRPRALIGFDEFASSKCLNDVSVTKKRQPLSRNGRGND